MLNYISIISEDIVNILNINFLIINILNINTMYIVIELPRAGAYPEGGNRAAAPLWDLAAKSRDINLGL